MVDRIVAIQQKVNNGDDLITVLDQIFDDRAERFRRMKRGVVEKNDASRLNPRCDAVVYLARG